MDILTKITDEIAVRYPVLGYVQNKLTART